MNEYECVYVFACAFGCSSGGGRVTIAITIVVVVEEEVVTVYMYIVYFTQFQHSTKE